MSGGYGTPVRRSVVPMWCDFAVLLVAVAAGALTMAVLAVVQPALPTRLPPALVWVAAAVGAVALTLAETAPTGWEPFDLVLRAAFGALVPLAAARAGTVSTSWLLLVSVATLFVALEAPYGVVAGLAAGAFWALAAAGSTTPAAAAVAAAAGIGAMGHVDWPVTTGASAAAVAVAALPVLLVGLVRTGRPLRGRITLALTVVVVLLCLGAVAGLVAALSARTDIDRAVDFATTGIDQLGDDDEAARASLRDAAGAFESAEEDLTTWWARPALAVPGVAQQARAVATMASAGADLARTAADASEDADVESIRPRNGKIDLEALVALQEPLDRSVRSLQTADERLEEVESPLLAGPIADRLQTLRGEVDDALGSAELAAQVVEVVPDLLGADGPRRYFIAFQNPAELRGNGGFLGNWAELTATGGQLELTRNGRNRDLLDAAPEASIDQAPIEGEEEVLAAYTGIVARWGNVNFTPDHPTMSRLVAQLYPQSGGAQIDGVIAMTPAALAGLLELTGPVDLEGYPEPITPANAERILLHDQYLEFPQQQAADREEFLGALVETMFDQLTSGELPGPRVIADELGPAVDGRNLQLWAANEEEQALFRRLGAAGDVTRVDVDSFGVVSQNFNGNKIDWFLHREIEHDVTWDPRSGQVEGTISTRVRNDAPAAGLPRSIIGWGGDVESNQIPVADGENLMMLTVYSTYEIERITVDGAPADFVERHDELGHRAGRIYLSVPSESVREVVAHVRGVVSPGNGYSVRALRQPTVNPDVLRSTVRLVDGWEIDEVVGGQVVAGRSTAVTRGNALDRVVMAVGVELAADDRDLLDRLRGTR